VEEICQSERSVYMVMEYLPINLCSYLCQRGFPPMFICKIFMLRLVEGVAELHSKDIMHRDLKLQNIMLRNNDITDPVIVDFGLARKGREDMNVRYCGTPGYIAPEVL
jgi:serine/threonine protein kinase